MTCFCCFFFRAWVVCQFESEVQKRVHQIKIRFGGGGGVGGVGGGVGGEVGAERRTRGGEMLPMLAVG